MDNPTLDDLLDRYENAIENGQPFDPEFESRAKPDLLEPLRARIEALQSMDHLLATDDSREESDDDSKPDLISQGKYHQLRLHDRGGLGHVYRAIDTQLRREVAVKIMKRSAAANHDSRQRFLRETEITGRLEHPGIVPIFGSGETWDGRLFYVMPFLKEGSLDDAIDAFHQRHPHRIDESDSQFRDLLNRLINVCRTIAYAHSRNIVHRDIKPKNIMLGNYGETVVIDWGGAVHLNGNEPMSSDGEDSLNPVRGEPVPDSGQRTPLFASPEQHRDLKCIGPESDIYSLGIVLYTILTGRPPLAGRTECEIRRRCIEGKYDPPRKVKPGVSCLLQAICLKALSLSPADRYATGLEMAKDLESFLADAPTPTYRDSFAERWARLARRHRKTVLSIFLGFIALTLFSTSVAVNQGILRRHAVEASRDRLKMAATLAAQAGAAEIDRRWRMLEIEANSTDLREWLIQVNATPEDNRLWKPIQVWLYQRFAEFIRINDVKFDSLFVNSASGIQVARVLEEGSIGGNFAFRDYFHGQGKDLPEGQIVAPASHPVLSGVYASKSDAVVKIAFSVPIWTKDGRTADRVVIGRLGMSMKVGDLDIFKRLDGRHQIPMLVETRDYAWGSGSAVGLIIDHSNLGEDLMFRQSTEREDEQKDVQPRLSSNIISEMTTVQRTRNAAGKVLTSGHSAHLIDRFLDPLNPQAGEVQAAYLPIIVPGRSENIANTGWYVVLQQRSSDSSE